MAGIWKTVRVFISSTFRDMHAERDHLVKVVFPALREKLQKHRIYLDDIDLRWGVTREQAESDRILDLCLKQIKECRPFFIGILGERYGTATRFPEDALRSFPWIQEYAGRSVTELEILHGVLNTPALCARAFFYFRDPKALDDIPEPIRRETYVETDADAQTKLANLKHRIRASVPIGRVMDNYAARWDPEAYDRPSKSKGRLVDLQAFGEQVRDQLWQAIKAEFQLPEKPPADTQPDPLAEEQDYHERFMESRLRVYVGREQINDALLAFADGKDLVPCLVTGPSGSGKSAALAKFVRDYQHKQSQTLVIPHFIGASPRSTNLRDMLRRFCQVLKARFGFAEDVPEETAKLSVTFREFVGKVPADARVLVVIDALNQLDEADRAQELYWLPTELPPQVKVIVSCISDISDLIARSASKGIQVPVLEAFTHRKHHPLHVEPLADSEKRGIIRQVPSLSAKTLDNDQVHLLLSNPATANPLFLLVALEELRGFAPYERLNERIAAFPREGDSVTAIFTQVIERLAEEFNQKLVETVLTLLASARRGLSERELQELVAGLDGADDLFPVLRQLRPYLLSRAGLIDFYHRNLFKAVRERYLAVPEKSCAGHRKLADYFRTKADPHDDDTWSNEQPRSLEELPYHLAHSGQEESLHTVLTDIAYLDSRTRQCNLHDLMQDFGLLRTLDELALEFRDFLGKHLQRLTQQRGQFFALLHHEGPKSIRDRADCFVAEGRWHRPWIRTRSTGRPAIAPATNVGRSMALRSKVEFEDRTCATDLASDRALAFHVRVLGQIAVAKIDSMQQSYNAIAIRPLRPLQLSVRPDAQYLAVAFDNGDLDLLKVNVSENGEPTGQHVVGTFHYLVPEFEAPVIEWIGDELIFQTTHHELSALNVTQESPVQRRWALSPEHAGELAAAVPAGDRLAVAINGKDGAALLLFQARELQAQTSIPQVEVTALCACHANCIAVASTDYIVRVCSLQEGIFNVRQAALDTMPTAPATLPICLASSGTILLWMPSHGSFFTWEHTKNEKPLKLAGDTAIFPEGLMLTPRRLAVAYDGTFVAATNVAAFRFAVAQEILHSTDRIQAIYQSRTAWIAVEKRKEGLWVLDERTTDEVCILREDNKGQRLGVTGLDGMGHLVVLLPNGQAKLMVLDSRQIRTLDRMPLGVSCVLGDPAGGFWITDRMGAIHFLEPDARCHKAVDVDLDRPSGAQLLAVPGRIVWYGRCYHSHEQGSGIVEALVFYRTSRKGALEKEGTWFSDQLSDGVFGAMAYDATGDRLVTFWGMGEREVDLHVKHGSPEAYLSGRVERRSFKGARSSIVRARITSDGAVIYALDREGVLFCLDGQSFEARARLLPSAGFNDLAVDLDSATEVLAVEDHRRPYYCRLEDPS